MNITKGWRFLTADFSRQAHGTATEGSVTLIRSPAQQKKWHKLTEEEQEVIDLYLSREGADIELAIGQANVAAMMIGLLD